MSRKCTKANPIGITNYNVERWAQLPSWQALTQQLNNVALEAVREHIPGDQDTLAAILNHLARGIGFMDCCPECERADSGAWVDTSAAPYATEVADGWVSGKYLCARGHRWTCGYSLRASEFI